MTVSENSEGGITRPRFEISQPSLSKSMSKEKMSALLKKYMAEDYVPSDSTPEITKNSSMINDRADKEAEAAAKRKADKES